MVKAANYYAPELCAPTLKLCNYARSKNALMHTCKIFSLWFKKIIKWSCRDIVSLNLKEANEIFRRAIIKAYFEPQLLKIDYRKSPVKHPGIADDGLTLDNVLHLYFDVITGNDYPDGDEWFSVEYVFPHGIKLPDGLKGPDYFTTLSVPDGGHYWRDRKSVV